MSPFDVKEYQRAYRERNRDRLIPDAVERHKRWAALNRDKALAATRAQNANRKARELGIPGRITGKDVLAVIGHGATCTYCGTTSDIVIDHVVAMAKGGPNEPSNLQPCCMSCNTSKGQRDRPGRWVTTHDVDACIECGSSTRRHKGHGLCTACYARRRYVPAPVSRERVAS